MICLKCRKAIDDNKLLNKFCSDCGSELIPNYCINTDCESNIQYENEIDSIFSIQTIKSTDIYCPYCGYKTFYKSANIL